MPREIEKTEDESHELEKDSKSAVLTDRLNNP